MVFYTADELAEMLMVNRFTILKWVRSGKLKGSYLGGKQTLRISQKDLEEFYESCRKEPRA